MKLYEFEGHNVLRRAGIESPFFVVCSNIEDVEQARKRLKFPIVTKVQVLTGKRGKSGGIKFFTKEKSLISYAREIFGREFSGENVRFLMLSEKVRIEKEFYISITYDTVLKKPILTFSEEGGAEIEEVKRNDPGAIRQIEIDPIEGLNAKSLRKFFIKEPETFVDFTLRLWDAFSIYDCRLVEVNPAALSKGTLIAVDAKVILDDNGLLRHRNLDILVKGAGSAIPTVREVMAKKIDEEDYRGSAGSTFIEFEGDIAILASGGGASLLVVDALIANGGKPANYTEYSGNPPAGKVEKLTKITLSREGLSGCLVAGAVANFTDIYETLLGFAEGLKQVKPKVAFPIVVRRGGPRQEEAYEMLAKLGLKEGYDFHLFGPETPISVAAKKMVELSMQFKGGEFSTKS